MPKQSNVITPFTDLLKKVRHDLLQGKQHEFAGTMGVSPTYASYLLTQCWVPDDAKIAKICAKIKKAMDVMQGAPELPSLQEFLAAARSQIEANPLHGTRPDKRMLNPVIDAPTETDKDAASVIVSAFANQKLAEDQIVTKFQRSERVRLLLIRGWAVIGTQRALLREALKSVNHDRFVMQVLMLDPDSAGAKNRAKEIGESQHGMVDGIRYALREILELREETGLNIEIRLYSDRPTWRLFFFDQTVFVSSFQEGINGDGTHMLQLEQTRGGFYDAFVRQFEDIWARSKCVATVPPESSVAGFSYQDAVALLDLHCDRRLIWHCKTVAQVARQIAEGTRTNNPKLDVELVEIGALLHDIGKSKSIKLDHAWIGAELVRHAKALKLDTRRREALARIIERHTGVGLSRAEIQKINREQKLNIPVRDYIPETLEEIVVAYADKLVVADQLRTFEEQLTEKKLKWGEESSFVTTLKAWQKMLGDPIH
jgi:uncharacterized protein